MTPKNQNNSLTKLMDGERSFTICFWRFDTGCTRVADN